MISFLFVFALASQAKFDTPSPSSAPADKAAASPTDIDTIKATLDTIKSDVAGLAANVSELQTKVAALSALDKPISKLTDLVPASNAATSASLITWKCHYCGFPNTTQEVPESCCNRTCSKCGKVNAVCTGVAQLAEAWKAYHEATQRVTRDDLPDRIDNMQDRSHPSRSYYAAQPQTYYYAPQGDFQGGSCGPGGCSTGYGGGYSAPMSYGGGYGAPMMGGGGFQGGGSCAGGSCGGGGGGLFGGLFR